MRNAKGKTDPRGAFALPERSYGGIASIVNRTMYFGSLGKILSSPDNVESWEPWRGFMSRYSPILILIAATLLTGCGGGTTASTTGADVGTGTQPVVHDVDLSWNPSPSSVIGYNIYRGTTSGGPYPLKLNSSPQPETSFIDKAVLSGTTYYYVATSLDANSVESSYSNQLTMVIP